MILGDTALAVSLLKKYNERDEKTSKILLTLNTQCDNIALLEMNIAFPSRSIRFSPYSIGSCGSEKTVILC
jgi:hypothetical protein